ncbi:potassium channel SKOR-like [Senna tora]|uniref:Potassium channel n=1 Tax=Senna tora TaxID=362788 RepID=A0A834WK06_9FABA|nr:potassium channel SKOR-like [Senna tora]
MEFGFFRGLPEDIFLLDIAGQFAFLIDIFVRFSVAYRDTHSHTWVYNRRQIASRYFKSRFTLDILSCLPWDYIYKATGRKEPVRYLLWIRLSRAYRVIEFFDRLEKDIRINYLFTRIVKLLVVELYCTHTTACIFYYLATTMPPSKEGYTWIGSLKMGDHSYSDFRHISLWRRYVTSLYFAIVTMVTVGYGDIHAVNVREMIFVMIFVSFDMILGAYLLGNMAALIVKGSRTEKFRDKMTELIKYMNKNNLDKQISKEIKGHLRLQFDRSYTEATIVEDIPASIRTKISVNLYEQFIQQVHLFKGCSSGFIKQIAIKVHEEFFLPGEVIMEKGNVVDQLYLVCHGELDELRREDDEREDPIKQFQTYSSFGEVSFLCNMPQPYTVRAHEFCKVLRLDKQSFTETLKKYFFDGRIILDNLLEGKESSLQRKLLESDFSLTIRNHEKELAMRINCAAYEGDFYLLKHLISSGADPNKVDYDGRSPLHISASRGYVDIACFLIEQGVNINYPDKFGSTPLLEAIKNGHEEVASLLVNARATLTIDDAGCFLCLTVANKELDLLRKLLAHGINPDSRNYDQRTPLHIAASEGLFKAAELLLEAGASVLSKDRWGNTPLDGARIGGNRKMIRMLEVAKISQLAELSNSNSIQETHATFLLPSRDENPKKKCTVFPFHPRHHNKDKRAGAVLWVPQSIEELIKVANEQLKSSSGSCILSEHGGKILDADMISNGEKLYLVSEAFMEVQEEEECSGHPIEQNRIGNQQRLNRWETRENPLKASQEDITIEIVQWIGHRIVDFQQDAHSCVRNFKDDFGAADDSSDDRSRLLPEITTWTSPHCRFGPKSHINHASIVVEHTHGSRFVNVPQSSDVLLNAPPRHRATKKESKHFWRSKAKSKKGRRSVTLLDIKLTDRPIQLGVANEQNYEANGQRSQTKPVAEPTGNGASYEANRQRSQTEPVAEPTSNRASCEANRQRSQTEPTADPADGRASCGAI